MRYELGSTSEPATPLLSASFASRTASMTMPAEFGDVPLNVELKLEVWDSPNSAGIVIDAVRLAKLALNNGIAGALEGPSSYLMKSPPKQIVDDEAYELTEQFIRENARTATAHEAPATAE